MTDTNEILKIQIEENCSEEEARKIFLERERAWMSADHVPRESKPIIGGINEQIGVD